MTRPGIVRADTLDLQDQDAPSAQDHTQNNLLQDTTAGQLGPHQAAEIRSVKQERQSEEVILQEAWDQANNNNNNNNNNISTTISNTLSSADPRQSDDFSDDRLHDQTHHALRAEDGEQGAVDEEEEDADQNSDDDLMDRMSSSPSIDDGAYPIVVSPRASQWPPRSSSLTPTRGTFNRSAHSSPDSSPFVELPTHLPLSLLANRNNEQDYRQDDNDDDHHHVQPTASPASTTRSQGSSPFTKTPDHFPLFHRHHPSGEYHGQYDDDDRALYDDEHDKYANQGFTDEEDDDFPDDIDSDDDDCSSANNGNTQSPNTCLPRSNTHYFARSMQLLAAIDRDDSPRNTDMRHLLLPEDDPLLEEDDSLSGTNSLCSDDSSSSWATVSDDSMPCNGNPDSPGDDDFFFSQPRFVDSGFGGECLRETEDIDFDFVYALHTFIATVEGQANATKGDTMVLLDDTNSYWWLVRLVKDQSIGYLPAEHIETPTERLARLNKHRNVDLSQAMLGDNMEKSKNPLKKAMRRRNAKTVQFAAPTYVEASDYEYDTEDEENAMPGDAYSNGASQPDNTTSQVEHVEQHKETTISTDNADDLRSRMSDSSSSDDTRSTVKDVNPPNDEPLGSPTLVDRTGIVPLSKPSPSQVAYDRAEAAPLKSPSRKGTPRNTDSFLKDDSSEPRRITLTPNILRDDNSSQSSLEKTRSSSFEAPEKSATPLEKTKEDKKKKEKKQGMLSGLFKSKKKDKKGKEEDGLVDSEKVSSELSRNTSGQSTPIHERDTSVVERKGKLQKGQPVAINTSTITVVSQASPKQPLLSPIQSQQPQAQPPPQQEPPPPPQEQSRPQQRPMSPQSPREEHPSHFFAELEGSQVSFEAPTGQEDYMRDTQSRQSTHSPEPYQQQPTVLQQSSSMAALTAITNRIRPGSNSDEPRRQKVKKAKTRVELDDFDNLSEEEEDQERRERLSESPVDIANGTFMHGTEVVHIPVDLEHDRNVPEQSKRTYDTRVSNDGGRPGGPSMLDTSMDSEFHEPRDRNKTLMHPGISNSSFTSNVSDITDDDPTPTHSKPQSPSLVLQHHPGLPNLQQTPTHPPAESAPFPPVAQPRQPPLQTENLTATATGNATRLSPHRDDSTSSTASTSIQDNPSPSSSTASTASKDTNGSFSSASLRAWLDGGEGNDIRDMLVVIHDKSNVTPVQRDHPLMKGLWDDERMACGKMMGELDGLLSKWLGKKKKSGGRSETPTPQNGVGIVEA